MTATFSSSALASPGDSSATTKVSQQAASTYGFPVTPPAPLADKGSIEWRQSFGSRAPAEAVVELAAARPVLLELRADSINGRPLGFVNVETDGGTGGLQSFKTFTIPVDHITGTKKVFAVAVASTSKPVVAVKNVTFQGVSSGVKPLDAHYDIDANAFTTGVNFTAETPAGKSSSASYTVDFGAAEGVVVVKTGPRFFEHTLARIPVGPNLPTVNTVKFPAISGTQAITLYFESKARTPFVGVKNFKWNLPVCTPSEATPAGDLVDANGYPQAQFYPSVVPFHVAQWNVPVNYIPAGQSRRAFHNAFNMRGRSMELQAQNPRTCAWETLQTANASTTDFLGMWSETAKTDANKSITYRLRIPPKGELPEVISKSNVITFQNGATATGPTREIFNYLRPYCGDTRTTVEITSRTLTSATGSYNPLALAATLHDRLVFNDFLFQTPDVRSVTFHECAHLMQMRPYRDAGKTGDASAVAKAIYGNYDPLEKSANALIEWWGVLDGYNGHYPWAGTPLSNAYVDSISKGVAYYPPGFVG